MILNPTPNVQTEKPTLLAAPWFWVVLIGATLISGGGWINYSRALVAQPPAASAQAAAPLAGSPAPDFTLRTPTGQTIRLSDHFGQPIIVNFWASWCGPCRSEFPEFQRVAVDNAGKVLIIGVNSTSVDKAEAVPEFIKKFGITFPIVLDEQGQVVETYHVLGLPTTVFINSKGLINEIFTGPLSKAYIESKIQELEAGQ